jgi:hypothetical protein
VQDGTRYETASRTFTSPTGPSVATVALTIVHNAYDHDVTAEIRIGSAGQDGPQGVLSRGDDYSTVLPVPGTSGAVSSDWTDGASTTGNIAWNYRVEVPAGPAEECLPPRADCPWRLAATEGGYLNRAGRVTAFDVIWHSPSGDVTYGGGPLPQQTAEGHTTTVYAPASLLAVEESAFRTASLAPNPVQSGNAVTILTGLSAGDVRIYDLGGREIGRAPLQSWGAFHRARWVTRGSDGHRLSPGVYFAGIGSGPTARLVILK